jgi:hypothetical protein
MIPEAQDEAITLVTFARGCGGANFGCENWIEIMDV